MKSFILCLLVLTAVLFCSAPAQASHFENRVVGVDASGNPVVAQVLVPDFFVGNGGTLGLNGSFGGVGGSAFLGTNRFNNGFNGRFNGQVVRGRRGFFVIR